MNWLQALLLGIVQGLTEFLPVSSSGHLMIFKEVLGVDAGGFMDFTVTVHVATVLSTLVVFGGTICRLFKGFFKFKYNDEMDYVLKLLLSAVPVAIVGFCFRDQVEGMFGQSLFAVAVFLIITAVLLFLSDQFSFSVRNAKAVPSMHRNGISYLQALIVGIGQACAVAPGLSRSGTTIATGLLAGVRRDVMAEFSFLMVLIPIVGEQLLDIAKVFTGDAVFGSGISPVCLVVAFVSAFVSGLLACKFMIAIVRKAKLTWFSLYCLAVALVILLFT